MDQTLIEIFWDYWHFHSNNSFSSVTWGGRGLLGVLRSPCFIWLNVRFFSVLRDYFSHNFWQIKSLFQYGINVYLRKKLSNHFLSKKWTFTWILGHFSSKRQWKISLKKVLLPITVPNKIESIGWDFFLNWFHNRIY